MEQENNVATSEPEAGLEQLRADARREHEMYLRALADFENYRRRVERDRAQTAAADKRSVILPLLEVLDGFERALPYLADAPSSVPKVFRRSIEGCWTCWTRKA